jgi:hypothetical protein
MRINLYDPSDLQDIERVFGSLDLGLDPEKYPLPDFGDERIASKIVTRTNEGQFIGFAYTRSLVEVALILDPQAANRKERLKALWALHVGTKAALLEKGIDRAVCFIAPKPALYEGILNRHGWESETERKTLTYKLREE